MVSNNIGPEVYDVLIMKRKIYSLSHRFSLMAILYPLDWGVKVIEEFSFRLDEVSDVRLRVEALDNISIVY